MDWLYALVAVVLGYFVIQMVRLFKSDCDLLLKTAEQFGKSPESLRGRIVWITGASSGIGQALALELASVGCRLVLSARRSDQLQNVKQKCLERGNLLPDDVLVLPLDLLAYDTHRDVVSAALRHFKKIDILVNNAGRSQRALWEKTSLEVDKQMLELNVMGTLSLTKSLLPYMIQQKSGHIVVTSSVAGKIGAPGLGSYCGSKHALQGWFDCLRVEEYVNNINVTMVCPGPVHSEALIHAFTDNAEQKLGVEMKQGENRMSSERCAKLMAIAVANKLNEVWISKNPELSFLYLFQYLPFLAIKLAGPLGQKRLQKVKEGKTDLHG